MGRKNRGLTSVKKPTLKPESPVAETKAAPEPYEGLSEAAKAVAFAYDNLSQEDAAAFRAACIPDNKKG